jgi:acylphosphatase
MQRAVITVRGRVQKVGYRDMAAELANKMNITGIVENLPDGKSIKIIAEAKKDVLDEFVKLLWAKDDPVIKVTNIDAAFEPATGEYEFFDIVYEDFEKEGFERIGEAVMYLKRLDAGQNKVIEKQDVMIEKQDVMIEKQDVMIEKQDIMIEKQDRMLEKQDMMIEKLDDTRKEIVSEIREMRGDLRSYLDSRFMRIEYDIAEIKAKIGLS